MCINAGTLEEIAVALMDFKRMTNNPVPMLKECFPDISFVRLSARDIDEAPYRELDDYNLYLLDTSEHCVKITASPESASGIVVAQR
jgi:hypothetical protein